MTRRKSHPENPEGPERAPAPPPAPPASGDTAEGLPEGVRVLASDGGSRYLVTDDTQTRGRLTGWVVDTAFGTESPHVSLDSTLVQTDPEEWEER